MAEFLAGPRPIIFVKTDIFNARVALEIENAFGGEAKELSNLIVAGLPELAIVPGIFDQNFVGSNGTHAVVDAIASAPRLTLDVVERRGMHN